MSRWVTLLVGMFLVGCSGATPSVRLATSQERFCVYIPRRSVAPLALDEASLGRPSATALPRLGSGLPVPVTPPPPPPLQGIPGEGLGNGVPRGMLRLVPEGGATAGEAGTGVATGEALVTGGAVAAAAGSVVLLCLTVTAVVDGTETPIDIADRFYGTHFGDAAGWIQGQYKPKVTAHTQAIELDIYIHYEPNGAVTVSTSASHPYTEPTSALHASSSQWTDSQRDKEDKGKRARLYATYTKLNRKTKLYYSGRTSMIVDLSVPLDMQAELAVQFRDMNHHIDENDEPRNATFNPAGVDVFDLGTAINYNERYDDPAYWRIRGREQQLIDLYGGAQSDTRKPYRTENMVRAVAKDNPRGRQFHDAATTRWGQLHRYTGH